MNKNLFFLLVILAANVSEVFSCNAKQFNQGQGSPTQKPSFLQSLKDAGKQQQNSNLQNNKESNKPGDGKTVVLYGKAQEHDKTYLQHPYFNDGKDGGAEKGFGDGLFQNELSNAFKSGSSFQYSTGNEVKNPNFGGGGDLFKTPLANGYKKGPGFQIQDGAFKENQPGSLFKNSFANEFNKENSNNDFNNNEENSKDNGGSQQFGYSKGPPAGYSIDNNADNENKGLSHPIVQLPVFIPTQQIPEQFKGNEFLPKPEAQKQQLVENNHGNNGNIKNIAGQLNFNQFGLFNNPSPTFDGGNNNLDFNDNDQRYNNGPFNNFNGQGGNPGLNAPHHQQSNIPLTGFYNINEPSGSWRNVDYNSGPTGYYSNVQHDDGHGSSYGDFKTFGTIQNFGL